MRINKCNPEIKSFTNEYKSSMYSLQMKMFLVGILLAENVPKYIDNYNKMMKLPLSIINYNELHCYKKYVIFNIGTCI